MTAVTASRPRVIGWLLFLAAVSVVVLAMVMGRWRLEELRHPPLGWRTIGWYDSHKACLDDAERHRVVTGMKTRCRRA